MVRNLTKRSRIRCGPKTKKRVEPTLPNRESSILCSNCHSMVHRRKPAFQIVEIKKVIGENSKAGIQDQ